MTTDPYQVLPDLPPEQFAALKADIAERGVMVAVDVDENGQILDGHNRIRACRELGINDYPVVVRSGLSEVEKRTFARKANALRRHLSRDQVRDLIGAQLRETPEWANNRIAQALGVDVFEIELTEGKADDREEAKHLHHGTGNLAPVNVPPSSAPNTGAMQGAR
jgi:ParB-like chromosome segregation protein Spo0J